MNKSLMLTLFGGVMACAAVTGAGIVAQEYMDTDYVGAEASDSQYVEFKLYVSEPSWFNGRVGIHMWQNGAGSLTNWGTTGEDLAAFQIQTDDEGSYVDVKIEKKDGVFPDHIIITNKVDGWNDQSADISLPNYVVSPIENLSVVASYDCQGWGTNITWKYTIVDRNADEETFRFFVKRRNSETSGKFHTFHYWDDSGTDVEIGASLWPQYTDSDMAGNNWLAAFDVPVEAVGKDWQIKTYDEYSGAFENATDSDVYQSGDNLGIHYAWDDGKTIKTGALDYTLKTDGGMVQALLEARDTCSLSLDNGSGNAKELYEYWFSKVDDLTLQNITINDYVSEDLDHSDGKTATVTALEKINRMKIEQQNGSASSSSAFYGLSGDEDKAVLAGGLSVGLAGILAGAAVIYRRRKSGARS